ncbi:hypothetical protein [Amycolatopsis thailandensis]|uniref:hypothetical protein n=1 Tax=Amycolatopsis thailandensis TaxID=589330 RepID=UPI00364399AB
MTATYPIQPNIAAGDDPYTRPFKNPELPGEAFWGHKPAHHNGSYVYPGRAVLHFGPDHKWPYQPEDCPFTGMYCRVVLGGLATICPQCGLDET